MTLASIKTPSKPHPDQEAINELLDGLRDSGKINMFGAPAHLQDSFGLSRNAALGAFSYWADNFGQKTD